jgi:hypothetical protein
VDFTEGLLAIGTGLALLPIVDHVPDHATFRVGFDLREALLSAILALGPARALIEANVVLATPLRGAALTTLACTAA